MLLLLLRLPTRLTDRPIFCDYNEVPIIIHYSLTHWLAIVTVGDTVGET